MYKETYTAFQRKILAEFMSEEELVELDKKYNIAKLERQKRMADEALAKIKNEE
jgi:hypothetical protein